MLEWLEFSQAQRIVRQVDVPHGIYHISWRVTNLTNTDSADQVTITIRYEGVLKDVFTPSEEEEEHFNVLSLLCDILCVCCKGGQVRCLSLTKEREAVLDIKSVALLGKIQMIFKSNNVSIMKGRCVTLLEHGHGPIFGLSSPICFLQFYKRYQFHLLITKFETHGGYNTIFHATQRIVEIEYGPPSWGELIPTTRPKVQKPSSKMRCLQKISQRMMECMMRIEMFSGHKNTQHLYDSQILNFPWWLTPLQDCGRGMLDTCQPV